MSVWQQRTSLRDPLARARGLGSAKAGVGHWWVQRLTAAALIVLGLWFVCTVIWLLGSGYSAAFEAMRKPWNVVLMILFLCTAFWHAQLGLQVVIEDYVHTRWLEVVSTVVVKFLAVLLALVGSLAVLHIAFTG